MRRLHIEVLGIRMGVLKRGMSASDCRYEAQRCWYSGDLSIREGQKEAGERWHALAKYLEEKAEREQLREDKRRVEAQAV